MVKHGTRPVGKDRYVSTLYIGKLHFNFVILITYFKDNYMK